MSEVPGLGPNTGPGRAIGSLNQNLPEWRDFRFRLRPPPALIVFTRTNLALPHVLAAARSVRGPLPVHSVWGQTASDGHRSEATTHNGVRPHYRPVPTISSIPGPVLWTTSVSACSSEPSPNPSSLATWLLLSGANFERLELPGDTGFSHEIGVRRVGDDDAKKPAREPERELDVN